MSNTPYSPATGPTAGEAESTGSTATEAETGWARDPVDSPTRMQRGRRVVAIGFMQMVALVGVVGLAVILGAVLVSGANESGWVVGLVIGAVTVVLTILVLLSGRHVRRH